MTTVENVRTTAMVDAIRHQVRQGATEAETAEGVAGAPAVPGRARAAQ